MIVVDTNLVAYLVLPGTRRPAAKRTHARDPDWAAPPLWRSELRNVLALYIRRGQLMLADAVDTMADASALLEDGEYDVQSDEVLRLAADSGCSAYDCEFVALARALGVPLVTADRAILTAFPGTAVSLDDFGAPSPPTSP